MTMKNTYKISIFGLMTLIALTALSSCSQKPTSEEVAAQVKIALEQEKSKEAAQAASAPESESNPKQVEHDETHHRKVVESRHDATEPHAPPSAYAPPPPQQPLCGNCGVVVAVNVVQEAGKASGLGVIGGGLVGGLLGNQVGKGTGRDLATLAGAIGGAVAGNTIEKNSKKTAHYDIVVQMDDGSQHTYQQVNDPGLARGDKVKIENGALVRY